MQKSESTSTVLSWKNISFYVKNRQRPCQRNEKTIILKNISGYIKSGEVTAVIGPSGAGKTSLLNIIAGRSKIKFSGEILCNGRRKNLKLKHLIGYVPQDDRSLVSSLNVRDNLLYAARLRLPLLNEKERHDRVAETIRQIGMQDVANTIVGNETRRGISGGQKKRLAIAIELIARPSVLLLDEPTTGLDHAAAFQIMKLIRTVAAELNIAVLATIHQPSEHISNMFDQVLLLAKGQTVYFGPNNKMLSYFENELVKPLPKRVIPMDHYLDTVNTDFHTVSDLDHITIHWATSGEPHLLEQIGFLEQQCLETPYNKPKRRQANFVSQTYWLVRRSMKIIQRDYVSYIIRILSSVAGAVLMGSLWFKLPNDTEHIRAFYGIAYNVALINAFSLIASIPDILTDRIRFMHEYSNGYYRMFSWYLSANIMSTLYLLIISLCFSAVAFFMVGFTESVERFFLFTTTVFLLLICGEALLQMISFIIPNSSLATALGLVVAGLAGALSGVFIQFKNMPNYWEWAKWLSFFKYGVNALLLVQYQGTDVACIPSNTRPCPPVTNDNEIPVVSGDELIEQLELTFTDIGYPFYCLIAYFVVHKTITLLTLFGLTKKFK